MSIYCSVAESPSNRGQYAVRWKETIRGLERAHPDAGPEFLELIRSVANWDDIYQPRHTRWQSVAVFRSPDVFDRIWWEERVEAQARVGPHFFIRPLLPLFARERVFYILALSQKDIRLLRCTPTDSDLVDLGGVPTSFDAYMNTAKPDHVRDNRSPAGPSAGHSKGVLFGSFTDTEDKQEYLAHFYKEIDRAVGNILKDGKAPLVLAGVEYELSLYRGLSSYPYLLEQSVQGAPNGLKGGEMHARALEALQQEYAARVEAFLEEYNHKSGGLGIHGVKDVVLAAHDGRVNILLVSDSLELTGRFEEDVHQVKVREDGAPEEEDLLNDAAVQTILHGGQVLVAPNRKMPSGAAMAALLRF
ncbi:MAG TPA: hypothetical protein VG168_11310 [Bryobacteraceae bacterium]|nr:hypothetical protein [Bryobacteraceae bacterium]